MPRFRSLQQKLAIYSTITSIALVGAVGLLSYYYVALPQVLLERGQLVETLAGQITHDISEDMQRTADDLRFWGEVGAVRGCASRGDAAEACRSFLDDLMRHKSYLDALFIVNPEGKIVIGKAGGSALSDRPLETILPTVQSAWIADIVSTSQIHGLRWQRLNAINTFNGRPSGRIAPNQYQFVLAAPAGAHAGQPYGVLVAVINWKHIQDILDRAQGSLSQVGMPQGYAFMHASDGNTIIGHKDHELYETLLVEDPARPYATVHHLSTLHLRSRNNPQGTIEYNWKQGPKIVGLAKVVPPPELGKEFEWRVGVGVNRSEFVGPVRSMAFLFAAVSLAVMLPILVLNGFGMRRVSVSLHEFSQLARDAAHGRVAQGSPIRSDDELGELADAFNELLVSFRSQVQFAPITNPYVVGNPIRNTDMFFGRHEDLSWIREQIERPGNSMVLLFGPRRIGKTSLLHRIAQRESGDVTIPIFLDTQHIIPLINSNDDFYHVLTHEMLDQLPRVLPGFPMPFQPAERFTSDTLRRLLRYLNKHVPNKTPVLLFDELENLEFKLTLGAVTGDILMYLASLIDGAERVSFVATGSNPLDHLAFPSWRQLIPKTIPRRIGLLPTADAMRLIREPVQGYVFYEEGVPEKIVRLTAGHPYYTQVVCQNIVDHLNHKKEHSVSLRDLDEVTGSILANPPSPLHHLWSNLSVPQKVALAGLAHTLTDDQLTATCDDAISNAPQEFRQEIADPMVVWRLLAALSQEDWLEQVRDQFRFRIDLFRLWIRQEHSIWHVADELRRSATA